MSTSEFIFMLKILVLMNSTLGRTQKFNRVEVTWIAGEDLSDKFIKMNYLKDEYFEL